MTSTLEPPTPWRSLFGIGLIALAMRATVALVICLAWPMTLDQYATLYDGESYVAMARAMALGEVLEPYHGRVFPGLPAWAALLHSVGVPISLGLTATNWLCAALATVLAGRLFNDRRVAWATACLPPHWVMNSSLAMTEAPMLALSLVGLLVAMRPAPRISAAGGAMLGAAGLVRPMACFAVVGLIAMRWRERQWKRGLLLGAAALGVVVLGMIATHVWRGNALAGPQYYANDGNTYGGQLLALPFDSLVMTPFRRSDVTPLRTGYVWLHAVVVLLACGLAIRHLRRSSLDTLAAIWLLGNTLFVLCVGSRWGFECFHRFVIPASPAAFWFLRPWLPRGRWWWPIAAATVGFAILSVCSDLHGYQSVRVSP